MVVSTRFRSPPPSPVLSRNRATFTAVLSPLLWLARVSGVCALGPALRLSSLWLALSLLQCGAVLGGAYTYQQLTSGERGFGRLVSTSMAWVLSSSAAVLTCISWVQGEPLSRLVALVTELELSLSQIGIKTHYSTGLLLTHILTRAALTGTAVCLSLAGSGSRELKLSSCLSFFLSQWSSDVVQLQIVGISLCLTDLFEAISRGVSPRQTEDYLQAATSLMDATILFQEGYGKAGLVLASALFLCTTLDLYRLMSGLGEGLAGIGRNPLPFLALVTRSYQLWQLVSSLYQLMSQAKWLDAKLYAIALEDISNEVANKEKIVLYFSMKQTVKFSACGFFPIDFTLVHSIVAAVTNYLIILVQFGSSKQTNPALTTVSYNDTSLRQDY